MSSPGAGVAPAVETMTTPSGDKSADELSAPEGWTKKVLLFPSASAFYFLHNRAAPDAFPAPFCSSPAFQLVPAKKTPKRKDVVYIAPDGEEIKTKRQLDKYLKAHPGGPLSSEFDWSTGIFCCTSRVTYQHAFFLLFGAVTRWLRLLLGLGNLA